MMSYEPSTEEYYKKFIELKESLRKSEEERLKLEMKFNEMVVATKEENQLHIRKLREKYKRFLEEDRRRQDRNQKIYRVLERIEARLASMRAKTERFKLFRQQHHQLLERVYEIKQNKSQNEVHNIKVEPGDKILEDYIHNLASQKLDDLLAKEKEARNRPSYSNIPSDPLHRYKEFLNKDKSELIKGNVPLMKNSALLYQSDKYDDYLNCSFKNDMGFEPNYTNAIADDIMESIYSRNIQRNEIDDIGVEKQSLSATDQNPKIESLPLRTDNGGSESDDELSEKFEFASRRNTVEDLKKHMLTKNATEIFQINQKGEQEQDHSQQPKLQNISVNNTQKLEYNKEKSSSEFNEQMNPKLQDEVKINNLSDYGQNQIKNVETKNITVHDTPKSQISIMDEQSLTQQQTEINSSFTDNNIQKDTTVVESEANSNNNNSTQYQPDIKLDESRNEQAQFRENDQLQQEQGQYPNVQPTFSDSNEVEYTDLLQQYDENGQLVQQYYDQNGQLTQQYDESEQPVDRQYYNEGQYVQNEEQTLIDTKELSVVEHDPIQSNDSDVNVQPTQQHDANNDLSEQYDPSTQINEHYDPAALSTDQLAQFDESGQPLNQYGSDIQPTAQYDETVNCDQTQPAQYDENGQLIVHYDENGQPVDPYDAQFAAQYSSNAQYDENGQLLPQYDENGQLIPQYDENGQLIQGYDPNQQYYNQPQYDENGQLVAHYDENGQLIPQYDETAQYVQQYDENGQPIQYQYDEHGQIQQYDTQSGEKVIDEEVAQSETISVVEDVQDQKNIDQPKKSKVMDMLDTDTESIRQDTKVSNDSDFDFSNG